MEPWTGAGIGFRPNNVVVGEKRLIAVFRPLTYVFIAFNNRFRRGQIGSFWDQRDTFDIGTCQLQL